MTECPSVWGSDGLWSSGDAHLQSCGWPGGWVGEWVGLRRWPSGQGRWVSGGAFSVVWLDDCRSWAVVLASRVSVRSLDARWRVDHCLASRSLPKWGAVLMGGVQWWARRVLGWRRTVSRSWMDTVRDVVRVEARCGESLCRRSRRGGSFVFRCGAHRASSFSSGGLAVRGRLVA